MPVAIDPITHYNDQLTNLFTSCLRPPPKLSLSEWADQYRKLSPEASAEPGQWVTARAEFQRGPMDAISDEEHEQVVLMTCSQVMKTEILLNTLGFYVHQEPAPILLVEPREADAKSLSTDRIAPMLRDTPVLRDKVKDPRARDSGNTLLHKQFQGGHMTMVGANSPAGLAMRPIRVALFDEVDRYPPSAGTEGDPVTLGIRRTTNFHNRKIVLASTPTIAGMSRIEAAFDESDKRRYHVPCPHCDTEQTLVWGNVEWDKVDGRHAPETARYRCEECGTLWTDGERWGAVAEGRWISTSEATGRVAGFHISALYSPWQRLEDLVVEYLGSRGKIELEKAFANTILGETFQERGEAPDHERLFERREAYARGTVPRGGLVLTAGVDVQDDRLEVAVVAWGRDLENWLVDQIVLLGDPTRRKVWDDLDLAVRNATFCGADGREFRVGRMGVDSGDNTSACYAYWRRCRDSRVLLFKGSDRLASALSAPSWVEYTHRGKKIKRGVQLYMVGSSFLKSELYGWLQHPVPDEGQAMPGYCHHPSLDRDYFMQLTAEELVTRTNRAGYVKREWLKIRPRNEALDCRVYARAAAAQFGLDRYGDAQWTELEVMNGIPPRRSDQDLPESRPSDAVEVEEAPPPATMAPPRRRRRKSIAPRI